MGHCVGFFIVHRPLFSLLTVYCSLSINILLCGNGKWSVVEIKRGVFGVSLFIYCLKSRQMDQVPRTSRPSGQPMHTRKTRKRRPPWRMRQEKQMVGTRAYDVQGTRKKEHDKANSPTAARRKCECNANAMIIQRN